jgi:carbon catabolite-derepressing protein kinase
MGYGIKDVQEALAAEEPSAIKDAYLIVRENKLMQANREYLFPLLLRPVRNDFKCLSFFYN